MKKLSLPVLAILSVCSVLMISSETTGQRRSFRGKSTIRTSHLRIQQLELRMTKLEQLLSGTSTFPSDTIEQAEAALAAAKRHLDYSERLRGKGYVDSDTLTNDRFAVARARHRLETTRFQYADQKLAIEIEIIESERGLLVATELMRETEELHKNGEAAEIEVQGARLSVDKARKEVERARARLVRHDALLNTPDTNDGQK